MNTESQEKIELHNNHNVYILGAGFSAFRGIPLVSNFLHCMRDAHEFMQESGRPMEANAIARVLQFRRNSASAAYRVKLDLENVEQLFSLASIAGDEYSVDMRLAIAATIDFAERTKAAPVMDLSREGKPPVVPLPANWKNISPAKVRADDPDTFRAPAYEGMVAALLGILDDDGGPRTNTILSFNYDLLVDSALTAMGQDFSYGFAQETITTHSDRFALLAKSRSSLRLLKLHGSMNWATDGTGGLRLFQDYDELRSCAQVPELIPPTWRKSFTPAIQSVWSEAVDAIQTATRLIVVGFSLPPTDLHFKYLLAAGLRTNVSLRNIVFYDINKELIERRVDRLFSNRSRHPKVEVFQQRAEQLISTGRVRGQISTLGRPLSRFIRNVDLRTQ